MKLLVLSFLAFILLGVSPSVGNGPNPSGSVGNSVGATGSFGNGYKRLATTPFATAIEGTSGCYAYWRMNSSTSTEPDLCGTNTLTYHGSGTQHGSALTNDSGAASYSPGGNASNYVSVSASLSSWPSSTSTTWIAVVKPATTDCNASYLGEYFFGDDGPTGGGTFDMQLKGDATACHFAVYSDNDNNSTTGQTNGSIVANTVYMLAFTYDKTNGIVAYKNCVSDSTNGATYPAVWSSQNGPVFVGQPASKSVLNSPGGISNQSVLNGYISDVAIFSSKLTPTQLCNLYAVL